MHDLFERQTIITDKRGNKTKDVLKHFSPSFALKGRMEVDEWFSKVAFVSCFFLVCSRWLLDALFANEGVF